MRVEKLEDRPLVPLHTLESGQCFNEDGGLDVYLLTEEQKPSGAGGDLAPIVMAVNIEDGGTVWFDEDTFVKLLYAKVVVEW